MNVLASECSSGCESGWTLYLEQSFISSNPSHRDRRGGSWEEYPREKGEKEEADDEDEDLSMVSDASSGPPHFQEDDGYYGKNAYKCPPSKVAALVGSGGKRRRNKEVQYRRQEDQERFSFLDDTASSPLINLSQNNLALNNNNNQASVDSVLDYSQGFSATRFQGRSAFQDHFGFLHSATSGNQLQRNQWL